MHDSPLGTVIQTKCRVWTAHSVNLQQTHLVCSGSSCQADSTMQVSSRATSNANVGGGYLRSGVDGRGCTGNKAAGSADNLATPKTKESSPLFLNSLLAPIPGKCKNRGFNRRNRPALHLLQSYSKAHTTKQIGREKLKTIFNLLPRSINRLLQNPVLLKREARLALLGVRWSKIVDVVCGNVNENAPADRGCFQEGVQ